MATNINQNIVKALHDGSFKEIKRILNFSLVAAEVADLIESVPKEQRFILWELIDSDNKGEVLSHLNENLVQEFASLEKVEDLANYIMQMEIDDATDIVQNLPNLVVDRVLILIGEENSKNVKRLMNYNENQAGSMVNTDILIIKSGVNIEVVRRYLRMLNVPEGTDQIFVVNSKKKLEGSIPMVKIATASDDDLTDNYLQKNKYYVKVTDSKKQVIHLFETHDLISLPVLDEQNILIGKITIDDVVDNIIETSNQTLLSLSGLGDNNDTFASVASSSKQRIIWLGLNLITACIASLVINEFIQVIEKVVVLAVLMPIVATIGGSAGNQALALAIRAITLNQINNKNILWLEKREILVGLMNGAICGLFLAIIAFYLSQELSIAFTIWVALMFNIACACVLGMFIPYILKKIQLDPAVSGGVILTTFSDILGYFFFLGLASLIVL